MHPNKTLIENFYRSFQQLDSDGMAACYHDKVSFSDPVFSELKGQRAVGMWKMLCKNASGFELTFKNIDADNLVGSAHWEAVYNFGPAGRRVHNKINAAFEFKDNKIITHHDSFNFWKWSIMALGLPGLLIGWTTFLKKKVRKQAMKNLDKFLNPT